jgi:hypothetical protein
MILEQKGTSTRNEKLSPKRRADEEEEYYSSLKYNELNRELSLTQKR